MGKFKVVLIVILALWLASYFLAEVLDTEIGDKIAIIPIKGTIISTDSLGFLQGTSTASSSTIIALLEKAEKNKNIKGVILEINSPGGTVVASKEVVSAVKKTKKPVVAWIREVGTSGAYWVASASDTIVADELSLTGSIGVISSFIEFSDLFEEYGITYEGLKTGKYKDIGSPFKKMTSEERTILLQKMDIIHDYFVADVSKSRDLQPKAVKKLATGIYYLGTEAKDLGLVDELGGKELAVNITKELANITNANVVTFEKKKTWFDVLGKLSASSFFFMGRGIGSEVGEVKMQTTPRFFA